MMDFIRSTWLLVAFACLMLLILSGCIRFTVTNPSGEVDAEITIKPTADAIENTMMTQELDRSMEVGISIPTDILSGQ